MSVLGGPSSEVIARTPLVCTTLEMVIPCISNVYSKCRILMLAASVVTFGEAMLRLTGPSGRRLADADRFDVHVAGAEANVAAALAQLGVACRWASRLPASPLGRIVERELAGLGVITDTVTWDEDGGRLGLFFAEPGAGVRPTSVVYDRAGSSFAAIEPLDVGTVAGARVVHVSGVTPALGPAPAAATSALIAAAEAAGALVSVDVNFRALLWSPAAAREALTPLIARADLVFCAERDARTVFGLEGDPDDVLDGLARLARAPRLVVLTRGEEGCVALAAGGRRLAVPAPPTTIVDRFGMGDALIAGVLWRLLDDEDDGDGALLAGVRLAALKATVIGDLVRLAPGDRDWLRHGAAVPQVVR
jgi:2-dehydro-3-deoxygluconokinase